MYRILIAEDDEVIAAALKRHLTSWGFEAAQVTDFSDFLGCFLRFDANLVLLDINLPVLNGYARAAQKYAGSQACR